MPDWKEIWSRKPVTSEGSLTQQALIEADGFNNGAGKVELEDWLSYVNAVRRMLSIAPTDSIFEFGCGSGALLYEFYRQGHHVGGIDYSKALVDVAQEVMPEGAFTVSEAIQVEVALTYDMVISNSVFQYFPDFAYAEEVLNRMWEKSNKKIGLFDLNDLARKDEALEIRRGSLDQGEYEKKYNGLDHLFFEREYFPKLLKDKNCSVSVFDQRINNYGNSPFRFNVVIEKW
ncbi:class I SAM-dependent methyltransferase [Paenibacillus hexagrammi]|uniref:Class I SAM-dependent methyltransferase n=1 Tax=Paenibacillus hexagrammi TaxID=2908839 RepID=A0ABY3SJ11_9BACL|nr:class I SAM-dependent methyltransferase [Paenibacillus sp. YPD9-1]UJF33219.1 class I SAM-dependent methyltransferase [Paenibacillus sp. YPD9-1]